jgi:pimeloyl-ACP methyl ester carboxylesterase
MEMSLRGTMFDATGRWTPATISKVPAGKSVRSILTLALLSCLTLSAMGQMFNVNGHRLYLKCQGMPSESTVVLIAGGGSSTGTWDKVQPSISKLTHVCSYDRLGLGESEPALHGDPQSVEQIVSDLESLLKAAGVAPPYILVGHSIGGLYARAFDARYDSQVAGIVLLDSAHEEQIWRFAQGEPEALTEYPRWRDQRFMASQGFLASGEHLTWKFSKPLVVIEHGVPPEPVWHEMQKDLASRSPKARFITATNSGHSIQRFQPQLVIEAVRSMTEEQRGKESGRRRTDR